VRRAGPEGAEASGGLGLLGGEALALLGGSGPLRGAGRRARPRGHGPGAIPCCASCSAVRARRRAQSCADSCRIVTVIEAGSVWGAARTRAWGGAAAGGFGWAGRGVGAAGGAARCRGRGSGWNVAQRAWRRIQGAMTVNIAVG